MSSAELTLWARVDGLGPSDVSDALWERRELVKTWAMRGTLHLLVAEDYPLWQAALSTYDHYLKASWLKYFGIDKPEMEKLIGAIGKALRRRPMTREELAQAVEKSSKSPQLGEHVRASWGSMLKPASFRGNLCFAPSEGRNVRFTHPGKWLDVAFDKHEPNEALAEVARRFVYLQGAITRQELGRWWAMSPAAAGRILTGLGEELVPVDIEGSPGWMPATHVDEARQVTAPRSVNLLPAFDQYVVTASARWADLTPGPVRDRIYRKAAWLSPVLLINGRMDGVWRHERKGKKLLVSIEPFGKIPAWAKKKATQEVERLEAYLGGTLSLTWAA
jgi:Winged helix DNA-binding domain